MFGDGSFDVVMGGWVVVGAMLWRVEVQGGPRFASVRELLVRV